MLGRLFSLWNGKVLKGRAVKLQGCTKRDVSWNHPYKQISCFAKPPDCRWKKSQTTTWDVTKTLRLQKPWDLLRFPMASLKFQVLGVHLRLYRGSTSHDQPGSHWEGAPERVVKTMTKYIHTFLQYLYLIINYMQVSTYPDPPRVSYQPLGLFLVVKGLKFHTLGGAKNLPT